MKKDILAIFNLQDLGRKLERVEVMDEEVMETGTQTSLGGRKSRSLGKEMSGGK